MWLGAGEDSAMECSRNTVTKKTMTTLTAITSRIGIIGRLGRAKAQWLKTPLCVGFCVEGVRPIGQVAGWGFVEGVWRRLTLTLTLPHPPP